MENLLLRLTNQELIDSLRCLVKDERGRTVNILKHLAEMDRRRLAEDNGFPSLMEYCVRELRYAHGAAAKRIQAARAAAKFRVLYRTLERGILSLSAVSLLAPHLTWDNHRRLIRSAAGKTAREIEALLAAMTSAPVPAERIRFIGVSPTPQEPAGPPDLFSAPAAQIPSPRPQSGAAAPIAPPAPPTLRVQFSFTGDERLYREVQRAKELLRHKFPAGRLEEVFEEAIKALLDQIDPERRLRRRKARARAPQGAGRRIPPALRDQVWRRDGGRCAFRSSDGRPCGARARLQVDHIVPWARGGRSEIGNLRLLCRAHNLHEARRIFGCAAVDGRRMTQPVLFPR